MNARGTFTLIYKGKDDYGITSAEGVVERATASRAGAPSCRRRRSRSRSRPAPKTRRPAPRRPHQPSLGRRPGQAHASRQGRGDPGGAVDDDRLHAAAAALHQAARQGPRRAAAQARARSGRPQARADRARFAPHRAGPVHAAMGRLHGLALRRGPPAAGQDRPGSDGGRRLALGDGAADRGWRSVRAERQLRAAQDRLREAMDRGAPNEEIKRLTDDLRRAWTSSCANSPSACSSKTSRRRTRTSARRTASSRRTTSTACSSRWRMRCGAATWPRPSACSTSCATSWKTCRWRGRTTA